MRFRSVVLVMVCLVMSGVAFAGETVSLAGNWRFVIDQGKVGVTQEWFKRDLAGSIKLPGTIDDAGLGPKNTKPPTLAGPYRLCDYAGPAWYQRDVEIPVTWTGKHVTLFLERCRWVTTVWLDDKQIGSQDSLIAPHVYDFGTAVAPGKHRLTICVDNTVKVNLGGFVSALFGGTWGNMNGIIGRIEMSATPPVWLEDVQVYPDVDTMTAKVKVRIGNTCGQAGKGAIKVGSKMADVTWDEKGGAAELEVDMRGAKLWDEFEPNLSEVLVTLDSGNGEADKRQVTFGMRKFEAKGTQFCLNGRPLFLRGTLECQIFPLTGYPPTDVASWQKIYRIIKSYGLNHMRFHSWCPPDAAFTAADIEGIMVLAEGPMANVPAGKDPARDKFIEAEYQRIVDTYGNHPSFCLMALGNEFGGTNEILSGWVDMLIKRDPRRLYSSAAHNDHTANRQWTETADGRGIKGAGTDRDLSATVKKDSRPVIGHEIGQWMYWPDFREITKWSGVMALKNYEIVRDDLKKNNLLDLQSRFFAASGKFATLLYKEEIEVLLRTPGYAGFSLLDLHDYPTQGTAVVGLLDAFWDSKGFITPEAYRRFCGTTVPLLRMPKRAYTTNEIFKATVDLSHFGPADMTGAQPRWTIRDASGREIASGKLPMADIPTGKLTSLGSIETALTNAGAPAKLSVEVSVGKFSNDWDIWVYPSQAETQSLRGVVVCDRWSVAKEALAKGQKVVFNAYSIGGKQSFTGWFTPSFWNPGSPEWSPQHIKHPMGLLCDPQHPLFAKFPTEMHTNWQWYSLMKKHSRVFILDDTPADFRAILQVIDNFGRNHKLGVVFEARVGGGKLLVCGFNLKSQESDPAIRQFASSLNAYAGSVHFDPQCEIPSEVLDKLFAPVTTKKPKAKP